MTGLIDTPRIVLAGASSGAGKTTLTVAIIAALRRRGLQVAPFKVGPDYLDPGYHQIAAGRPSRNVDGWMMGRDAVLGTFARSSQGCDVAVIEGVMGLFDGALPTAQVGSTAEISQWLDAPTVLVVDAGGMARSYAALCQGYAGFDPQTPVKGTIANRVGSQGHLDLLRKACAGSDCVPRVLGGFPKDLGLAFSERHLGLVTADAEQLTTERLDELANLAEAWLNLDELLVLARSAAPVVVAFTPKAPTAIDDERIRIGIAQDAAFQFYYEENLHLLAEAGASLVPFSPLRDARLPDVDGLYLGGGYPEIFAEALAENQALQAEVRAFVESDRPVYAECGGMMYLQRALRTLDGREHKMVGVFDGVAEMRVRRVALGYVEVEIEKDCLLGAPGIRFRGHQFRYSDVIGCTAPSVYSIRRRRGRESAPDAYVYRRTLGSYVHGHWASHPAVAQRFVESCQRGVHS